MREGDTNIPNLCGNNASTVTATATTTTSSQVHDDGFAPLDDEILILPDGRNLAYRVCGYRACNDTSSSSSSSSDNDNATIRRHMIVFAFSWCIRYVLEILIYTMHVLKR